MYRYLDLLDDVERLKRAGAETGVIGQTELGFPIPYIFLGRKNKHVLLVAAGVHAREHITCKLVSEQIFEYLLDGTDLKGGIYFVPMLNIDGIRLCQEGPGFIEDEQRKNFLIKVNGGKDFSLWKANANAVDINVNFDAHWGTGEQNLFFPAPFNYVGSHPMSEKETIALAEFTKHIQAQFTVSYHCKGEVIYWRYFQEKERLWRDYRYARFVSAHTGYKLMKQTESSGGFKDWCVETLKIPALTVEVGNDNFQHPFPYSELGDIIKRNKMVPKKIINTLSRENFNVRRG